MHIEDDAFPEQESTPAQNLLSLVFGLLYPVAIAVLCFILASWYLGLHYGDDISEEFHRAAERMIYHLSAMVPW